MVIIDKIMTFIISLLILVFIFIKVLQSETLQVSVAASLNITRNDLVLANDGSINFEENAYFKKYVINLKEDIKDIDWNENHNIIELKLDKGTLEKLAIRYENKNILNDIGAESVDNKINIHIKTGYKNNFVYKDLKDSKKLIVLVAKSEKPYDYKVVIDPGHGDYDIGTSYKNLREKDITLKIALATLYDLTYNGCEVTFTRDKDIAPRNAKNEKEDIRARVAIANDVQADLFLSIHINDYKDANLKGITTYYYCPNNFQYKERTELAKIIEEQAVNSDGWYNRGIRSENYGVLRSTKMPSVLIECGYMSNEEDRDRLTKEDVVNNLASNIDEGIIKYLNSTNKGK